MNHAQSITRLLATTALAILAATGAQAKTSAYSDSATPSAQVEQLPRSTVQAKRIDSALLPGQYGLSNGMRLVISGSAGNLRAALDGAGSRRLLPTDTPNVYKSRDGQLEVEFIEREAYASPDLRLTLLRPASNTAANTTQSGGSEALKLSRAD